MLQQCDPIGSREPRRNNDCGGTVKAGLYARVSTAEQTLDQQLLELREVASARKYETVEYVDRGLSGALPEHRRPALQKMMDDAKRGKIKVIMCWDVSRLGRSVQIVVDLVERMRGFNVQFTTLRDNIDTTTAQGEFQFHVFAAMAQLARKMIGQNTRAKLALLKDQGVKLGRPHVGRQKKRKPVNIADVKKFKSMNPGSSLREIEAQFGISRMTVSRMLSQKGVAETDALPSMEGAEKEAVPQTGV
jgi:DNA invertase Pin-like site-specific DNA recombinase